MRWLTAAVLLLLLAVPAAQAQAEPTGQGITIAVVDSGVDGTHPELEGRVTRVSFAQPDLPVGLPVPLPLPADPNGQGTAVASVAAGETLGPAPAARILDLQVSAGYTNGLADPATEEAAIRALDYLLQDPSRAQVAILSFAQGGLSPDGAATLAGQAARLWSEGVLVVVPAGPSANPLSSAPQVVTVSGSEACSATFATANLKPDVAAPSQGVRAATPGTPTQPAGTAQVSGTAYAAAFAGGVLAQLRSGFPQMPVDAATAFLRDGAIDLGDAGPDRCYGFGAIDAESTLAWAGQWRDPVAVRGSTRDTPLPVALLLAPFAAAVLSRRRA